MKLKKNYVLRNVAGSWIVLPLGEETVKFNGMIRMNETAVFLWKLLEKESNKEEMFAALTREYDVSEDRARISIDKFLDTMNQIGCIEM